MNQKQKKMNRNPNRRGGYTLQNQGNYSSQQSVRITSLDPHLYVTLKYTDNFQPTVATISGAQQIFNLNSIFDPDRTGAGHQPYQFDQLAAIYNRYRVLKVHYKFVFSAAIASYFVLVVPVNGLLNSAITTSGTWDTAAESPRSRVWNQGPSGSSHVIQGTISLNDLNGCTTTEYLGDDRFESAVTTSPTEVMTLYVGFYNPNAASVMPAYTAELYYEVDFHDVISLGGS